VKERKPEKKEEEETTGGSPNYMFRNPNRKGRGGLEEEWKKKEWPFFFAPSCKSRSATPAGAESRSKGKRGIPLLLSMYVDRIETGQQGENGKIDRVRYRHLTSHLRHNGREGRGLGERRGESWTRRPEFSRSFGSSARGGKGIKKRKMRE